MTPQQEAHLSGIQHRFAALADAKYRRGQAEHGGDLFRVDKLELCDRAIDEAIDQVAYLLTLRDQIVAEQV